MRTTHTYATLEVSQQCWDEVSKRIRDSYPADSRDAEHYFDKDGKDALIVLGEVALKANPTLKP